MRLNKEEGIKFLKAFNIPTVETLDINKVIVGEQEITKGLSVRLSPLNNEGRNVYLPSIHNCTDINEIRNFVNEYQGRYKILIHETVNPEIIGAVCKLEERNSIVIETYNNFDDRKNENISNRVIIPLYGEKMMISKLEMLNKDEQDFKNFRKVIYCLYDIPFSSYDMEYVIQDGEVVFTELTLPKNNEYLYLKRYLNERNEGREID